MLFTSLKVHHDKGIPMFKKHHLYYVLTLAIVVSAIWLGYVNQQLAQQNQILTDQVKSLGAEIKQLKSTTFQTDQRISKIEEDIAVKYRDLAVLN